MYKPFEAFRPHFNALGTLGFFKIINQKSKIKKINKIYYTTIVLIIFIVYNLQHLIRLIQVRNNTDEMINTLVVYLTSANTLGKQFAFYCRKARIEKIIANIEGSLFAPCNKYQENVMRRNAASMFKFLRSYQLAVLIWAVLWTIYPIVNWASGKDVQFSGYIPFDTSELAGFAMALAYMSILITWLAFATVAMDCTIIAFYLQAKIQLQLLRHSLEHIADLEDENSGNSDNSGDNFEIRTYKDVDKTRFNNLFHRRFVKCIKHHQLIVRFGKEIESVFGEAMVVKFLATAWIICMILYRIVGLNILSTEFCSMAISLVCLMFQLFIYCYGGTQLKNESELVSQSIYESEWTSLSVGMRRQLLIMMTCCTKPISPCIAYIVPMSIDTYITILKSSYSLYTFLNLK